MDGPNVNISFFRKLQADFKENHEIEGYRLFDLGSCGLYVVNGAIETALQSTKWDLTEFLRAIDNLFKFVLFCRLFKYNQSTTFSEEILCYSLA